MDIMAILYIILLNPYTYIVCTFVIGLILTIQKPKPWKYFTLLSTQFFFTLCWSIRLAWINAQTWGKFGPPDDELWISLALPMLIISLIVTAVVAISTRKRWHFYETEPRFCSDLAL